MACITPALASAVKPRHAPGMSLRVPCPFSIVPLACLTWLSSGCNSELIDPSDAAVLEVKNDAAGGDLSADAETAPDSTPGGGLLAVTSATASATGLAARLCWGGSGALDPASIVATFGATPVTARVVSIPAAADRACFDLAADLPPGKHSLRVTAADVDGLAAELWLPLWVEAQAFDWRKALLYMVMVDRFRDSDGRASPEPDVPTLSNYQGGDLGGMQAALEEGYFTALGVDALWITPVLDNAPGGFIGLDGVHVYTGYHGYWPISATAIDDHLAPLGTTGEAAFRSMISAAHQRGVRIVLDVVLNHVHEQHSYCSERPAMCKRTCVCGTANCDWEARALDCQFATYLPDLDYRDPETLARVVADLMAFVSAYDIDGLRLDAVKHMDVAVVRAIRARVDAIAALGGAPFWLIGETFAGSGDRGLVASFLDPGELDGQFDFPLYWTIRDTFVGDASFRGLETALVDSANAYGNALGLMSPFLGNHDVERIATALAKNDLGPWGGTLDVVAENTGPTPIRWDVINPLTMAMAFVLTLPGVPLVYMGDELGLGGSNDPDNRRLLPTVPATDQAEILRRVRELGRARREHPVLAIGARRELWQDDDIYVQARWLEAAGKVDTVIVAMNKGDNRTVSVTLPPELAASGRTFRSLLSDRVVAANGDQLELSLASWEYVLLKAD